MRNRVRLTMLRSLRLVWLRTTLLCELNCARLDTKFLITHALVFVVAKWAWYTVNCYLSERSMLARKNPLNPLWMYHLITFAQSSAFPSIYYTSTEIYSQNDSDENIVLCLVSANAISDANGELSLVKKHRSRRLIGWTILFHKWKLIVRSVVRETTSLLARKIASYLFIFKTSKRFGDVGSIGW